MSLYYSSRQQRPAEALERGRPIVDFAVRPATLKWPKPLHMLLRQLTADASEALGHRTAPGRLAGGAICSLAMSLSEESELDGLIIAFRGTDVELLLSEKEYGSDVYKNLPKSHTGLSLPEPVHVLLEGLQDNAELVIPTIAEITGTAVCQLAGLEGKELAKAVTRYEALTVAEVFPDMDPAGE